MLSLLSCDLTVNLCNTKEDSEHLSFNKTKSLQPLQLPSDTVMIIPQQKWSLVLGWHQRKGHAVKLNHMYLLYKRDPHDIRIHPLGTMNMNYKIENQSQYGKASSTRSQWTDGGRFRRTRDHLWTETGVTISTHKQHLLSFDQRAKQRSFNYTGANSIRVEQIPSAGED